MNYYYINLSDHARESWVLHEVVRPLPKRPKKPELGPAFYKLFRAPGAELRVKPQYQHLCCKKCGRYDAYEIYDVGFEDPVCIQMKPDYGHTNDRVFIISDPFLRVLQKAKVGGYETKLVGTSGWHALRVTLLVDCDESVVKTKDPACSECGRPASAYGLFKQLNQLSLPTKTNTFFTTKRSWPFFSNDRDLFITEEVFRALKAGGIKGGYCTRLLNDEESKTKAEKAKQGLDWKPPGVLVALNGKIK